jgi:hypothetical protein
VPQSEEPGSWDDLLDGKADFGFGLQMYNLEPMDTQLAVGSLNPAMIVIDAEPAPVPEPSSALPALLGLSSLLGWYVKRRND